MKEIYRVQYEVNDGGWLFGDVCFSYANDAVKHMRKYIAHEIMAARADGCKVQYLCVFRDTAMNSNKDVHPLTQTITYKVTDRFGKETYYEYRIWASLLYDKDEYKVDNRFGYYWL